MNELDALIKRMRASGATEEDITAEVEKYQTLNPNTPTWVPSSEMSVPTITQFSDIIPNTLPTTQSDVIVPEDDSDIIVPTDEDVINVVTPSEEIKTEPFSEIKITSPEILTSSTKNLVEDAIDDLSGIRDLKSIIYNYPQEAAKTGLLDKININGWIKNRIKLDGYVDFKEKLREQVRIRFQQKFNENLDDHMDDNALSKIIESVITENIEFEENEKYKNRVYKAWEIINAHGEQRYFDLTAATSQSMIDGWVDPIEINLGQKLHDARLNRIQYNQLISEDNTDANAEEIDRLINEWNEMQPDLKAANEAYNDKYTHDKMLIDLSTGKRFIPLKEGDPCENCVDKTPEYTEFMNWIEENRKSGDLSKIRAGFSLWAIDYRDHQALLDQKLTFGELDESLYRSSAFRFLAKRLYGLEG